ncbi:EamA family transporter [Patescibacteria group bacterium]|nr:EamA family transporter [Patescibacteria group bacterium]MBU1757772.1 EamA family transporter [Patescibacteria group bacterium]
MLDKLLVHVPIVVLCFFSTIFNLIFWTLIMVFGKYSFNIKEYVKDKNTLRMLILVTVLFLVANATILLAIKGKNATVASLIEISYPLFVILFSFLFFRTVNINR